MMTTTAETTAMVAETTAVVVETTAMVVETMAMAVLVIPATMISCLRPATLRLLCL